MEEFAIFVKFVNFGCHNNYFRPGPRLLYARCSFKKSTITNHISTREKHKRAKETLEKRQAREQDIAKVYDQEVHPKGSASVSMDSRVLRVRVVEIFLMSGIPISKIDCLRSLLEEGSCRLTHSSLV